MKGANSLHDLKLFTQGADRGNVSEVACQLNITTAAVSAAIKRPEIGLGVSLFKRTTCSLRLSAAGEALVPRLQKMFGVLDISGSELRNLQVLVVGDIRMALLLI